MYARHVFDAVSGAADNIAQGAAAGYQGYVQGLGNRHEHLAAEAIKRYLQGDYAGAYEIGHQAQSAANELHGTDHTGLTLVGPGATQAQPLAGLEPPAATAPGPKPFSTALTTFGAQGQDTMSKPLAPPPEAPAPITKATPPDWQDPKIQRAVGVFVGAPAPQIKAYGPDQSLYQIDNAGHATFVGRTEGKNTPHVVGEGAKLVDDQGNVIATGAPKTFAPQKPGRHVSDGYLLDDNGNVVGQAPNAGQHGQVTPAQAEARAQQRQLSRSHYIQHAVDAYVRQHTVRHSTGSIAKQPTPAEVEAERSRAGTEFDTENPAIKAPARAGNVFTPQQPAGGGSPTGQAPFGVNRAIGRAPTFKPEIDNAVMRAATTYSIPQDLFRRLVHQESGGNPRARSPKGAMGLTQLMPDTARSLGVRDPYSPEENVFAGAKHLAALYQHFGNWRDAVAAYNAGADDSEAAPGKLIGPFAKSHEDPRYRVWEAPYNAGYAETRHYVNVIIGPGADAPVAAPARTPVEGKGAVFRKGQRVSALPDLAPHVASLYERYGITPGAANALA